MISVYSPYSDNVSFKYVVEYLFTSCWGLQYNLYHHTEKSLLLKYSSSNIEIQHNDWSMFALPKKHISSEAGVVLFDEDVDIFLGKNEGNKYEYDFFYYIFLILSRYEELDFKKRDSHLRFPCKESFMFPGLIFRPIVDEYSDFLKDCLISDLGISPDLFREQVFKTNVSFDIDTPRNPYFNNVFNFFKGLIRGVSISKIKLIGNAKEFLEDDFFNYPEVFKDLDVGKHNPSIFVIAGDSHKLDGSYKLEHHSIKWLIEYAKVHGIGVGLHGSYNSFDSKDILENEKKKLEQAVGKTVLGIRQHFLRFEFGKTLRLQQNAGFEKDWSLGYAESIGFRAGTCRPFKPFCHETSKALDITEESLIVMDATLSESKYMNLTLSDEMIKEVKPLYELCKKHNGHFNILFHNTYLRSKEVRKFYHEVLSW